MAECLSEIWFICTPGLSKEFLCMSIPRSSATLLPQDLEWENEFYDFVSVVYTVFVLTQDIICKNIGALQ